jgi:hypothetical protein
MLQSASASGALASTASGARPKSARVVVSLALCLALAAAPGWGLFKAFYDLIALSQEDPMPLHYGIDLIAFGVVGEASIVPAFAGEPVALGNHPAEFTQHDLPPYTSI